MIRLEGAITYTDGRVVDLVAGQYEFAAWERYALRSRLPVKAEDAPPITMLRYLGYCATFRHSGKLEPDWPTFDEWQLEVEDVTLEAPEGSTAGLPPIPQVASVE